jgi:hypothetical protein
MSAMEAKREKIVAALHAGTAIPDIMKALKTSRATIFCVKKCLKDSGQVKRKPGLEEGQLSSPRRSSMLSEAGLTGTLSGP